MWARATIRSQRRSLVATALLLGLVGAIVLAAAAGARRTSSASTRYQAHTLMPEAFVNVESLLSSGEDPDEVFAGVDSLAELPGVTALAPFSFMAIAPLGKDGEPVGFGGFAPTDERLGTTVARTLVHEGRSPDPTAVNEVGVNPALADALGVGPGDHLTVGTMADFATEEAGPEVEVIVTGVETGIFDLTNEGPLVHPTAAFYEAMGDDVAHGEGYAVVDLAAGTDGAAFVDAARAIFDDREDVVIQAFGAELPGVQPTIDAQALALRIGAGVFALTAVVVIGQAVARHVSRIRSDEPVLEAVGMTRFQRAGAAATSIAPAAVGGSLLALLAAWSASPFMPIGVARTIEPNRGIDFDTTVLVGGAIAFTLLTLAATAVIWYLDIRRDDRRRSPWAATVARPLSPPAGYGVRNALRPTHAVMSRVGTVAGLTGVIAALVFGATLHRLLDSPERYGIAWDGEIVANSNDLGEPQPTRTELADGTQALRSDADIVDTTVAVYTDGIVVDDQPVGAYGIEGSTFEPTVIRGRAAADTDEVTLGAGALEALDVSIGETVTAVGADGELVELTVVGEALFPVVADNAYDYTGGLTLAGFERLASEDAEYRYLFDLRDGADPEAVVARHGDLGIDGTTTRPTEVGSLSSIDGYPRAFAIVFGVMAAGAAAYGLASGLRSSRRDIAVLRALGFTRRDVHTSIRSWLLADLGVAFVLAVVAGAVIGLRGWAVVADGLHVADDGLVPILGLTVVMAGVLLLAALCSPAFGRAAAANTPTTALRIE